MSKNNRRDHAAAAFLNRVGTPKDENSNDNVNEDININVNKIEDDGENKNMSEITGTNTATIENKEDFLDELLGGGKKKDDAVLTGIYLQSELAQLLDLLGKKGGRGAKSRIVNDALRKYFKEKGLM